MKKLAVYTKVTADNDVCFYLDINVSAEHVLNLIELQKKYDGQDIFQIDDDDDRDAILESVSFPEYTDSLTLEFVRPVWVEDVSTEELQKMIKDNSNKEVNDALDKLD